MEKLDRVQLGRTDLRVSPIWFGSSALGSMPEFYGYEVDEQRALETIRAILDGASNVLDTSRNYHASERRIGNAIRERGGLPEGFAISTKLDRHPATNRFDADRARRSLEESLKTLGLERVDVLHLHDAEHAVSLDEITSKDGAIAELLRMKEEGLADAVGLAAGRVEMMIPMLRDWDFDVLITHNRFTLANRNAEPMIEFASSRGIAVLNAAPYGSGVFAKGTNAYPRYAYRDASDDTLELVRRAEQICGDSGVPLGAAALQFSLRDPRITATICGATKPEHVAQTFEWAAWPIAEEVWTELLALPFRTDDPM